MLSIADGLPPEIARQVHPDWRRNESEYWAFQDSLLRQYEHEWVAFADGAVIATGKSPVEVFHAAHESGKHPYVVCVGREHDSRYTRIDRSGIVKDATNTCCGAETS